jgi:membrane protein DedA with SNARE-associated domain
MPDLSAFLEHWRYPAIFAAVLLGNVGLPVPEETVLALGGFLAHRGELQLPTVIAVGLLAAIVGDQHRLLARPSLRAGGARALRPVHLGQG